MSSPLWLPSLAPLRRQLYNNYADKIGGYVGSYGITPTYVTSVQTDNTILNWMSSNQDSSKTRMQSINGYTKRLTGPMKKKTANPAVMEAPPDAYVPALPAPPPVPEDIYGRWIDYVAGLTALPEMTEGVLRDLGVWGVAPSLDPALFKATFKVLRGIGNQTIFKVKNRSRTKSYRIMVNYGKGAGYELLATATMSEYTDTSLPVPAKGTSLSFKFTIILLRNDRPVGLTSDEVGLDISTPP